MTTHHLSRTTIGIPGILGVLLLAVWLVGWALFHAHAGAFHLLVPIAAVLILAQGVRRINADDDA